MKGPQDSRQVTRKAQDDNGEGAFERLQEMVASDMAEVNEIILRRMESPVAMIPQLAG